MCGAGGIWEMSVPPSQFCSKPKTVLKNKIFKKEIYKSTTVKTRLALF